MSATIPAHELAEKLRELAKWLEWHAPSDVGMVLAAAAEIETKVNASAVRSTEDDGVKAAVAVERARCASIIQAARFAEIERDWRSLVSFIENGTTVEELKAQT